MMPFVHQNEKMSRCQSAEAACGAGSISQWILVLVYDQEKFHQFVDILQQAMDEGWLWPFPPLVAWGECLITGSHRYAAAEEVGWECEGLAIDVVQLVDMFEAAGLDFDALHARHDSPTIDDSDKLIALLGELPDEIRAEYGIDLH